MMSDKDKQEKTNAELWSEFISDVNPDALQLDPRYFDEAVIGISFSCDCVLVYDYDMIIELLVENEDMDHKEAIEHADYNILGSKGEHFPIYIRRKKYFDEG